MNGASRAVSCSSLRLSWCGCCALKRSQYLMSLPLAVRQVKQILDDIVDKLPDEFNMAEIMGKVEDRTPYVVVAFQVSLISLFKNGTTDCSHTTDRMTHMRRPRFSFDTSGAVLIL